MVMTSAILFFVNSLVRVWVVVVRLMLQLSVCVLSQIVTNVHCKHRSCKTLVTRFSCECPFLDHDKSKFIYLKLQSSDMFFFVWFKFSPLLFTPHQNLDQKLFTNVSFCVRLYPFLYCTLYGPLVFAAEAISYHRTYIIVN